MHRRVTSDCHCCTHTSQSIADNIHLDCSRGKAFETSSAKKVRRPTRRTSRRPVPSFTLHKIKFNSCVQKRYVLDLQGRLINEYLMETRLGPAKALFYAALLRYERARILLSQRSWKQGTALKHIALSHKRQAILDSLQSSREPTFIIFCNARFVHVLLTARQLHATAFRFYSIYLRFKNNPSSSSHNSDDTSVCLLL